MDFWASAKASHTVLHGAIRGLEDAPKIDSFLRAHVEAQNNCWDKNASNSGKVFPCLNYNEETSYKEHNMKPGGLYKRIFVQLVATKNVYIISSLLRQSVGSIDKKSNTGGFGFLWLRTTVTVILGQVTQVFKGFTTIPYTHTRTHTCVTSGSIGQSTQTLLIRLAIWYCKRRK